VGVPNTQESFDFICVGSGGGGLVGALAAHAAGLRPLIIEKQPVVGGSTGMSGGLVWMPNNPLMRSEGVPDSFEEGMTYFESVVGPPDEASSLARRRAFLTHGPEMLSFLIGKGMKFSRCEGWSDYYDNLPGGNARSRSVEAEPWDGKQLGDWYTKVIDGMGRGLDMAVKANEARNLPIFARTPRALAVTARVVARTYLGRLRKQDLFTTGMSLVGQILKMIIDAGIPIWLDSGVEELVVENGRVVGVRVSRNGTPVTVTAKAGVLLCAGGFDHNAEMRMKYSKATQPNDGQLAWGNPGATGEMLEAALSLGAKAEYMDEAIWLPDPRGALAGTTIMLGRQYPRAIVVNKNGRRFVNESNSYIEVGRAMYANDAVPAYLIFDDEFRRRYSWGRAMPSLHGFLKVLPGRMPKEWVTQGLLHKATTLEEVANIIGASPDVLSDTVARFNRDARNGRDPEFGRGASQYNKALGDPANKPNPALGPVETAPFYVAELLPADVGTIGGVITDEHSRVVDQGDAPIPGLYAAGNMAATVLGRNYLGGGASIAHAMTFGYIAARNAGGTR
jgi:3-oxosteroid 1-dehydrogenase